MSSTSVHGLKAQLRGKPTLARYNYATVFVDHFSPALNMFIYTRATMETQSLKGNLPLNGIHMDLMSRFVTIVVTMEFSLTTNSELHGARQQDTLSVSAASMLDRSNVEILCV